MSTLRLIKGELDKIFVRPVIFVMTGFFIIAMVLSALVFSPTPRQDNRINFDATSVSQVYNEFESNIGANQFKNSFNSYLYTYGKQVLDFYRNEDSTALKKADIVDNANWVKEKYQNYRKSVYQYTEETGTAEIISKMDELKYQLNNIFKPLLEKINNGFTTLLLKKSTRDDLINDTGNILQALNSTGDINSKEYHDGIVNRIDDSDWVNHIVKTMDDIQDIIVDENLLNKLNTMLNLTFNEKLPNIEAELITYKNDIVSKGTAFDTNDKNIQKAKDIVSKYKLVSYEVVDIIKFSILIDICQKIDENSVAQYYDHNRDEFKSYNYYEYSEKISRYNYLLENDIYEFQFANVFQAGMSSNFEANAYDYMYFAMELLSILIILFCVILGADMIAGEQASGTLKLLAIRPYKRSKILNSKINATILFGTIFIVVGMIASFIIGAFTYGIDNTPILLTFNATTTFTISPFILMLIYLATLLLRIIFFTIIAVFLSTVFKSNIASISISFLLYLVVALFARLLSTTSLYKFIPFNNADLFKYFGGEFINNGASLTIFGLDFTPPIAVGMSFFFSLIVTSIFTILLLIITHIVFKNRDIS